MTLQWFNLLCALKTKVSQCYSDWYCFVTSIFIKRHRSIVWHFSKLWERVRNFVLIKKILKKDLKMFSMRWKHLSNSFFIVWTEHWQHCVKMVYSVHKQMVNSSNSPIYVASMNTSWIFVIMIQDRRYPSRSQLFYLNICLFHNKRY